MVSAALDSLTYLLFVICTHREIDTTVIDHYGDFSALPFK